MLSRNAGIYYWMKIMHHKKVGEIEESPNGLLNRSQDRSIQWLNMPSCHPCTLGVMLTINFKNMMTQLKQSLLTYLDIEDDKFITKLFISLSVWSLTWSSASFCQESILGYFFNFLVRNPRNICMSSSQNKTFLQIHLLNDVCKIISMGTTEL
jgi:hypothetical protein